VADWHENRNCSFSSTFNVNDFFLLECFLRACSAIAQRSSAVSLVCQPKSARQEKFSISDAGLVRALVALIDSLNGQINDPSQPNEDY
jgi:hypothetical protein